MKKRKAIYAISALLLLGGVVGMSSCGEPEPTPDPIPDPTPEPDPTFVEEFSVSLAGNALALLHHSLYSRQHGGPAHLCKYICPILLLSTRRGSQGGIPNHVVDIDSKHRICPHIILLASLYPGPVPNEILVASHAHSCRNRMGNPVLDSMGNGVDK